MPMSNEQFTELLKSLSGGGVALPTVTTTLDRVIPLPVGSKTLIGLVGTVISMGVQQLWSQSGGDISQIADVAIYVFTTLGGAGLISKYQRQIDIAEKALQVSTQVLQKLQQQQQAG